MRHVVSNLDNNVLVVRRSDPKGPLPTMSSIAHHMSVQDVPAASGALCSMGLLHPHYFTHTVSLWACNNCNIEFAAALEATSYSVGRLGERQTARGKTWEQGPLRKHNLAVVLSGCSFLASLASIILYGMRGALPITVAFWRSSGVFSICLYDRKLILAVHHHASSHQLRHDSSNAACPNQALIDS